MSNVVVNGCFDVLHAGHIYLLEQASKYGRVIVLLNSDGMLGMLKGRVTTPYAERKYILESIKYVSLVNKFDTEEELLYFIKKYNTKYLVKGEDYLGKKVTGSDVVEDVIFVPFRYKTSTSKILNLHKSP